MVYALLRGQLQNYSIFWFWFNVLVYKIWKPEHKITSSHHYLCCLERKSDYKHVKQNGSKASHLRTQRCQAFFFLLMNELNNESITEIAARVRDWSPDCITVFQALAKTQELGNVICSTLTGICQNWLQEVNTSVYCPYQMWPLQFLDAAAAWGGFELLPLSAPSRDATAGFSWEVSLGGFPLAAGSWEEVGMRDSLCFFVLFSFFPSYYTWQLNLHNHWERAQELRV